MPSAGMNEILPEVHPGDVPSARGWNTMAEMVMRTGRFNRGAMRTLSNGAGNFTIPEPDALVINNLGAEATIPSYGIVFPSNRYNNDVMGVKRPDVYGAQDAFYFAAGGSIAASQDGEAQDWSRGIFVGRLNGAETSPSLGDHVGPLSGDYYLHAKSRGFIYLGNFTDGSGDPLIFVKPAPMWGFYGKNAGSRITKGNTGTINIFIGDTTKIDSGFTMANVLALFGDVPANAMVWCEYDHSATHPPRFCALQTDTCP